MLGALLSAPVSLLYAQTIPTPQHPKSYSVLALGTSLKVGVTQNGVYRITYEDLVSTGLVSQPIPTRKLAVYGNVSGPLPYFNTADIYDDLAALPFSVYDPNRDGMFGPGDYLVFYAQSQTRATYQASRPGTFSVEINPYCDTTYYFVGTQAEYTPEIPSEAASAEASAPRVEVFPDYVHHEQELYNVCEGGATWLGERFVSGGISQNISLPLPGAVRGDSASAYIRTAGVTTSGSSSFTVQVGGNTHSFYHRAAMYFCAQFAEATLAFSVSDEKAVLSFLYNKESSAGNGYIDKITVSYKRRLALSSGSLNFRSPQGISEDVRFRIESSRTVRVWDVTDIYNLREMQVAASGNYREFAAKADNTLHEYTVFEAATCPKPRFVGLVGTQNLHAERNIDYVIVSHPSFVEQAREIARIHREKDGYTTLVTTTQTVFNEFSSGAKDPSAFRLLMKKLSDNSDSLHKPRFLCLFGAASYDYKNILGTESDFVSTLQSFGNGDEGAGDPLDDNFAYTGPGEGISPYENTRRGTLDVAVGRIPVHTVKEAEDAVEKIDIYSSPRNFGDWKSEVAVVTDDSFEPAMESTILKHDNFATLHPEFHLNKLYSDAYVRTLSSTSTRVPALENAIKRRYEEGSLFVGYYGHSGWDAWSDEKILTAHIIDNLKPNTSFPISVSSSCSFARFDNIGKVSGAERLVLREHGGAIAIMGTSRQASTGHIEDIFSRFLYALTDKSSGRIPTIGEAYLTAKVHNTGGGGQKFLLLGDPGLKVALPQGRVETLSVSDTLRALGTAKIEGCVTDLQGNILSGFNGKIITKVYDKPLVSKTLGLYNARDGKENPQVSYRQQNSLIFQGETEVKDGKFEISFMVPKDIRYEYGFGKIIYYAYSDSMDADGSYSRLMVGGFDENAVIDTNPPVVRLRLDGPDSRGLTVGAAPTLYAEIHDEFGINTTGSGLGHDMTLVIDGDERHPLVVNDLFRYELGSYRSGSLSYLLDNLQAGRHTAKLKVWNINNISATATLVFEINDAEKFELFDLLAAPNPSRGQEVRFYFTHNGQAGSIEKCTLQVFDLRGARVAEENYSMPEATGHSVCLRWNPTGARMQNGIYLCRIVATDERGKTAVKTVKLVVSGN